MRKSLNIFISALAFLLAVPAVLILVSWNALPGDSIFPVKTGLEKVALRIVGGTQLERTLEVKYTERRFSEADKLLSQHSTVGLAYFVPQAQTAKEKVIKAQDTTTKETLVTNLTEFNQILEERKEEIATIIPTTLPSPPTAISPPSPAAISPPSPAAISPSPDILPSPSTSSEPEEIIEAIENTQEEIEEIIEELKEEVSAPPRLQMQEEHEPQRRSEPPARRGIERQGPKE